MRNFLLVGIALIGSFAFAQSQPQLNVMPLPASVQMGTGEMPIGQAFSANTTGFHDASLDRGVARFVAQLSRQTGIPFRPKPGTSAPALAIHAEHGREAIQKLGEDESYDLTVASSGATLNAPTPLGILRGLATFLQLVEPGQSGFVVPAVTIKDQPRFPWRGMLIDVSRHFLPVDALKRNLEGMAAVKMNVLHWHLSDDQGFRVESKKFPKLTAMGSDGQFYSQEEVREILSYAHDLGIRVIPEFDIPGHSRSWMAGYPELASGPGPYTLEEGDPIMDPTRESTYKFLDGFLAEMAKLFPDAYFHIGGDEVDGKQWDSNPKIQEFIHSHNMKSNQDLQAYFNQRLLKILTKNHKIMVGWDEILHPDLPKNIIVQSWRGQASLAAAAKQGYTGLLSNGYYLDLMWPASRHYAVDPMSGAAADLSPEEKKSILGGESCMWAEWVTPENVDSHIWPRNAAIAERLWSPQDVTDVNSMYARLEAIDEHLTWLGLTQRSARSEMLHRMTGASDISSLQVLADVLEPVKDYHRSDGMPRPIDFHAPLNRMIDAIDPESDIARDFSHLVETYIQSGFQDKAAAMRIRHWLELWRNNDAKLKALLPQSFLLEEVAPLSKDLYSQAEAGLSALDALERGETTPEAWRTAQQAVTTQAETPRAGLLLMVAAPIEQLVEASGTPAK